MSRVSKAVENLTADPVFHFGRWSRPLSEMLDAELKAAEPDEVSRFWFWIRFCHIAKALVDDGKTTHKDAENAMLLVFDRFGESTMQADFGLSDPIRAADELHGLVKRLKKAKMK